MRRHGLLVKIPVSEVKLVKIPSIENSKVKILIALKLVLVLVIILGQRLGVLVKIPVSMMKLVKNSKWCVQVKIPEQQLKRGTLRHICFRRN